MMELEGKLRKSGKFWLVEVPAVEVMTQAYSREEALKMIADAIEGLVACYFPKEAKDFKVFVKDYKKGIIGVSTSNNSLMQAFSLRRQRTASKSTIREVAERLGSSSPNAYARYEKGRTRISLDQYERLLQAVNPEQDFHLRVV
jgi:predicted RNase H-like HicB family nuclease